MTEFSSSRTHASVAELVDDLVRTQAGTGSERHRVARICPGAGIGDC